MKPILALDLGMTTGWAVSSSAGAYLSASGSETFAAGKRPGLRFLNFKRWLSTMHGGDGFSSVYFERVRRHQGIAAAHCYGGFVAILTAWCEAHEIPYTGIEVAHIKQHATGKGNADKKAMIASAIRRGHEPKDDNEADGIALLYLVMEKKTGG